MPANYHTVRLTAATATTLPRSGMFLARVRVVAGTTPGSFSYLWNGSANAVFLAPSNGTRGSRTYHVNHRMAGTTIPAAAQTFLGGVTFVELIFTDTQPSKGDKLDDLRGISFRRVDAGAVTANIAVDYDVAPAAPKRIEAYISASAGRFVFPVNDGLTPQVEAIVAETAQESVPAPNMSASNSLTLSAITDAAATIHGVVYY